MEKDMTSKVCRECKIDKPINCFEKNQVGKDNRIIRRPVCKECRSSKVKVNLQEKKKFEKFKPLFGEPFKCPICEDDFTRQFNNDVVLDHSHIDGSVRGYICGNCNTGLGRFKDNVRILHNAIRWLQEN
jgi:hypothetical protein